MAKRGTHKPRVLTEAIKVKLPRAWYEWVRDEAGRQGFSMAQIMRNALISYIGPINGTD